MKIKNCIFCGNNNLTKEHIFPHFMRKNLPHYFEFGSNHYITRKSDDGEEKITNGLLTRYNGRDHRDLKLKIVCAKCNNEWMSNIDNKSKNTLISLLADGAINIRRENYFTLATWVTKFLMVYEYADTETITITDNDRLLFKNNQQPMDNLIVYIGNFSGIRHAMSIWHRKLEFSTPLEIFSGQITIFTIGKSFILTASANSNSFIELQITNINEFAKRKGLKIIWPEKFINLLYIMDQNAVQELQLNDSDFESFISEFLDFINI